MYKKVIYCLDCNEIFNITLENYGYEIIRGNLGYTKKSNKTRLIEEAPFECDCMIFNLTDPACYDSLSWGPDGDNDNFRCRVVKKIDKELIIEKAKGIYEKYVPRYKLIEDSQINKSNSNFDLYDLRNAISLGGIDCIYFLNPVFMFHSLYGIPNWLGISFSTKKTKIKEWSISKEVINFGLINNYGEANLRVDTPIRYALLDIDYLDNDYFSQYKVKRERVNFLINKIGESLAVILKYGKGFIFFLPPFFETYDWIDLMINSVIPNFKEKFNENFKRVKLEKKKVPVVYKDEKQSHTSKEHRFKKVFIVHGHNEDKKNTVARYIEQLGLKPIVLHEQPNKGKTIIEKFEDFSDVSFAIVLLTADDLGCDKEFFKSNNFEHRARQNVIFELGFFVGKLGRQKVCALYEEGVAVPSDYKGVIYIPFKGNWKVSVARELKASGINIKVDNILNY